MFLPLTVTLVSAPGLLVFLVARSSFFTWATASIMPLNKRALNRIRFISDVVSFSREYTTRAATPPQGLRVKLAGNRTGLSFVLTGQVSRNRRTTLHWQPVRPTMMRTDGGVAGALYLELARPHSAIGLLPTLRERLAKDGAPTAGLCKQG